MEIAEPEPPEIKEETSDSAREETRKKTGEMEDPARKMSPNFLPRKSAFPIQQPAGALATGPLNQGFDLGSARSNPT